MKNRIIIIIAAVIAVIFGCAAPLKKDISVGQEETTFEEIKSK